MRWMLFRREDNNSHFMWNGDWPIAVWPESGSEGYETWHPLESNGGNELSDTVVEALNDAANKKGTRLFYLKRGPWDAKHKYLIIARGEFPEE